MVDHAEDAPLHPSFFEGRVLIEMLAWDWPLRVSRTDRDIPRKHMFQGGTDIGRSIVLEGRILAPSEHRGRDIDVYFTPFGPKLRFGRGRLDRVGWLHMARSAPEPRGYSTRLLLPEADLALLAVAVSATTRYLHIWTSGLDVDVARVTEYSLSATIGNRVKPWAGLD